MSIEDRMTIDERHKYLREMQERYLQGNRKARGQLLDEMEAITARQEPDLADEGHDGARGPGYRQCAH